MAKSASSEPAAAYGFDIARKAQAVARKVAGLRADLTSAHELVHQAQVREALTRSELTVALGVAMKARAEAETALRRAAAQRYLDHARAQPLRRRDRLVRGLEKLLMRLGPAGQARVIAEAGVWRGDDPAAIRAYVKRGVDPLAPPATLFAQAWYLASYPAAARSGLAPRAHYVVYGAAAGLSPHPLVLPTYYHHHNAADLAGAVVSPREHFLKVGAARGRNPHPVFDVLHYAA